VTADGGVTADLASAGAIAALPMYDFPELVPAHDALWSALQERLTAHGIPAPLGLSRHLGHFASWRDPHLLLGQACEYPLAKHFQGVVRLVASPRYTAPGCLGASYRSAIVVRHDDPATNLADLRERRCAVNEDDSNSGMNLLRAAIAPLARGGRFFSAVIRSGSHRHSAALVAEGNADVAALDCVSWAHFQNLYPAVTCKLRVLAWTEASPSLPLITAAGTSDTTLDALRASLASVSADETLRPVRAALMLAGFDFSPADDFSRVLELERQAAERGYPILI
jgi:ABC-type phosphate/phosphonate transport system substrate-binding protein